MTKERLIELLTQQAENQRRIGIAERIDMDKALRVLCPEYSNVQNCNSKLSYKECTNLIIRSLKGEVAFHVVSYGCDAKHKKVDPSWKYVGSFTETNVYYEEL